MTLIRRSLVDLPFGSGVALALVYVAILAGIAIAAPSADLSVGRSWFGSSDLPSATIDLPSAAGDARPGIEVSGSVPAGLDPARGEGGTYVTVRPVRVADVPSPTDPGRGAPRTEAAPGFAGAATAGVLLVLGLASAAWTPNLAGLLVLVSLSVATLVAVPLVAPPLNVALLVPAPVAAALYASDRRRRLPRAAPLVVGVAVVAVLGGWLIASAAPIDDASIPPSLAVLGAVTLGAAGVLGVLRGALTRAQARRTAAGGTAPLAPLLADELVPGRSAARLTAIESERARLAAELHAAVLPDLSAVIREIEAGASPDEAAARLRAVAIELRDLMSERSLAILEEIGLVRALEWLAEHVEARTGVAVILDVSGTSDGEAADRMPHEVETAFYRIAQQALDNALLHARPSLVTVRVAVTATRGTLDVADDGTGIAPDAEVQALRAGHLGISDMRQRAGSIGAAFDLVEAPGGGTRVEVRWPA